MRKKIMILSPFAIHDKVEHAGGKTILRFVRLLASKYSVHLLCLVNGPAESALVHSAFQHELIRVETFQHSRSFFSLLAALLSLGFRPIDVLKDYSSSLFKRVRQLSEGGGVSLALFEYTSMSVYMDAAIEVPVKILDEHDLSFVPLSRMAVLSNNFFERIILKLRSRILEKYEKKIWPKFDAVIVRSTNDKRIVSRFAPLTRVCVLTDPFEVKLIKRQKEARPGKRLLYYGAMYRASNQDAACHLIGDIFPLIKAEIPDIVLDIVGSRPSSKLIGHSRKDGVNVHGWVENPEEYFHRADVFVAPVRIGGGVLIKILTAMSLGLPVVASSIANEGIGAEDKRSIIIADDPALFAGKVVELLANPEMAEHVGANAKTFIEENYSGEKFESNLMDLLSACEL